MNDFKKEWAIINEINCRKKGHINKKLNVTFGKTGGSRYAEVSSYWLKVLWEPVVSSAKKKHWKTTFINYFNMHSQEGYSALSVIYATGLESHENQSFTEQPGLTVINHGSLKKTKNQKTKQKSSILLSFSCWDCSSAHMFLIFTIATNAASIAELILNKHYFKH